jgi:hypothetical protein
MSTEQRCVSDIGKHEYTFFYNVTVLFCTTGQVPRLQLQFFVTKILYQPAFSGKGDFEIIKNRFLQTYPRGL